MNEFETCLIQESTKAMVDVGKVMVEPSAKVIGETLGAVLEGTIGWIGYLGEKQKLKQEYNLKEFKKKLCSGLQSISKENRKEPLMSIAGTAIEAAKFYYEEEYYREMFSNLIAASCDKSKINDVHPSYVEIIKQLSPLDAKFLDMFKYYNTYPIVGLNMIDQEEKIIPGRYYVFDFKDKNNKFEPQEQRALTTSLENLIRLGIVIKNKHIHELNYDYEQFRKSQLYTDFSNTREDENDKIKLIKYRLELTNFGRKFIDVCLKTNNSN